MEKKIFVKTLRIDIGYQQINPTGNHYNRRSAVSTKTFSRYSSGTSVFP